MKRIKIMLMGICLIALAGGVLAFKARNPAQFCTTVAITTQVGGNFVCPAGRVCPNLINTALSPTTTSAVGVKCYTQATLVGTQTTCSITTQQGGPQIPLDCSTDPVTAIEAE